MDLMSCNFLLFKHSWLAPIRPCLINTTRNTTYLMDLVSCGFCRRSLLNIFGCFPVKCVSQILGSDFIRIFLKVFHWTEFNKQYISWLYLMDLIFMLLFRRFVLSQTNIFLKKMFYLIQWNPFKNDQKCFLFHLKSFFCSQDI